MRLLVRNHLHLLASLPTADAEVVYAPAVNSPSQEVFFRRRFEELRRAIPQASWEPATTREDFDLVLAWDAPDERRRFGDKVTRDQNRLFDTTPHPIPEGFTPFRIQAEKVLPKHFPEARPPLDREVQAELDYYFRQKRLPLTYLDTRNQMLGRDGSTRFSAFLSCGALDVRHLYNEVRAFEAEHGATKSTGWIIFELLWREFFHWHSRKHGDRYFSRNGLKGAPDFSPFQAETAQTLQARVQHPFFLAALNELTTTGFLHNRTRQIFASVWINDLHLDWRAGAKLFEDHLIDYDVHSNYGNWMYLAGVGVDPRGQRYFDVAKQLATYDSQGAYLRRWSATT